LDSGGLFEGANPAAGGATDVTDGAGISASRSASSLFLNPLGEDSRPDPGDVGGALVGGGNWGKSLDLPRPFFADMISLKYG